MTLPQRRMFGLGVLDDLGEQLLFHMRAAAAVPRALRKHGREVVRLLGPESVGRTIEVGLMRGGAPAAAMIVIGERPLT